MVIMVTGLPGSGKSFFASRLAKSLEATYLSSDIIRKEIIEVRQYSEEEKEKIYKEMLSRMLQALTNRECVVLDATFYKKNLRTRFSEAAKKHSVKFRQIKIEAEESIIRERLSHRREHSDADWEVYQLLSRQYENIDGEHLVLQSGRANIKTMQEKALHYLRH
ncbi:MAG: AAA family ATPase [Owenweeksia sp.]|nr:AAA family ATPase [Owenweeksia sp.]